MVDTAKNLLIIPDISLQMRLKLYQKNQFKKKVGATGDLIGNKTADKITKISRTSPQNSLETFTDEHDKEISTE